MLDERYTASSSGVQLPFASKAVYVHVIDCRIAVALFKIFQFKIFFFGRFYFIFGNRSKKIDPGN